jgi:hypothetical protein
MDLRQVVAFFVEGPNLGSMGRANLLALRLWYPRHSLKFQWIIMKNKLKRSYLVCVGQNMRG